ncbi:nicotinate-nucleotide adenylyltransferase [Acidocella sp.]|uniref:nicotinate-nucleotide adenylyltransferase n=1 Tax=Acidocella sp. TaxID=50710 RepID=UPI00261A0395|nr:nicotinate-nucleotide adenylyltransferase [Acidocella sp.]
MIIKASPLIIPRYGHRHRLSIGILGGSFNPAHEGHAHIARQALAHARLNQVWLMVSPGNPLKPSKGMAPFAQRLASAARQADGHRLIATAIEAQLGTRYTINTLTALQTRFPRARFVWLMGADNLAQLPKWRRWRQLAARVPMLVLPRPGETRKALASQAAHTLAKYRQSARATLKLAQMTSPAWSLLPVREHAASATAIRQANNRS